MPDINKKIGSTRLELYELITLREAAELCGLSHSHLRLLIRQGDIWGKKMGRDWFTNAQAVREYLARFHRPGPKKKKDT